VTRDALNKAIPKTRPARDDVNLAVELLFLILPLMLIAGLWARWIEFRLDRLGRRRKAPGQVLPRCGRCNYVVHRLPGRRCPECGSDLTVVGIGWRTRD
jgi:hypothetical protein